MLWWAQNPNCSDIVFVDSFNWSNKSDSNTFDIVLSWDIDVWLVGFLRSLPDFEIIIVCTIFQVLENYSSQMHTFKICANYVYTFLSQFFNALLVIPSVPALFRTVVYFYKWKKKCIFIWLVVIMKTNVILYSNT